MNVSVAVLYGKDGYLSAASINIADIEADPCSVMGPLIARLKQRGAEKIYVPLIVPTELDDDNVNNDENTLLHACTVRLATLMIISSGSVKLRPHKRFMTTKSARK